MIQAEQSDCQQLSRQILSYQLDCTLFILVLKSFAKAKVFLISNQCVMRVLKSSLWGWIYVFQSKIAWEIQKWVQNNQLSSTLKNIGIPTGFSTLRTQWIMTNIVFTGFGYGSHLISACQKSMKTTSFKVSYLKKFNCYGQWDPKELNIVVFYPITYFHNSNGA